VVFSYCASACCYCMLRDMSNVAALYDAPDTPSALTRPLSLAQVAAGFPSPADDHLDRDLDLHERRIQHPSATYYVRLSGDSMQGFNMPQRLVLSDAVAPGDTFHMAVFGINGPISAAPANTVWFREARVEFF
jgi:hypothetical protein